MSERLREQFNKPKAEKPKLKVGQVIDGREVVFIRPVMRPYLKKGQDTYPVSWTVGWRLR